MDQLTAEQLLQSIWMALRRIEDNMALPPAPLELPLIQVPPPDLTDIVTAVQGLSGSPGPTADDIARAIADVLSPGADGDTGDALRQVAEGLRTLDHRLQGFGKQAYGGGSVSMSPATINQLAAALGGEGGEGGGLTDAELRAAPVPVSGSFSVTGSLTDEELRAAPVAVSGTFWQATQPVSGTVAISNPTETGLAKDATLTTRLPAALDADGGVKVHIQNTSGGGLTDVQLRATPIDVAGTFWQATQPVSLASSVAVTGPLTDAELRATPIPVSGSFSVTGALTDAELRATPVPVSGTVATGGLTDAELRASAVPISLDAAALAALETIELGATTLAALETIAVTGTFWQATQPVSGTFWPATQPVSGPVTDAQLRAAPVDVAGTVTADAGTGPWPVTDNGGSLTVDNAQLSVVGGGTEAAAMRVTIANNSTGVLSVDDNGGSLTVDGTFWQATQPVSGTFWQATQPVSGPLTDAQLRATAVPVSGTFWQATQPVSGTVTANAGTGTLAVSNTVLSVVGSGTEATAQRVTIATDSTGVLSVDDNGGSLTVDGTFWPATQPVSGTFWQATQPVSVAATLATQEARCATGTLTSVASSATVVTLLASNANRRQATIYNDSTATLNIALVAGASATVYTVKIPPSGYYELPQPIYTGIITGIWASANGSARVTELT